MLRFILFAIMCTLTFSAILTVPNIEDFGKLSTIVGDLIIGNFDKWKSHFAKLYTSAA